MTKIFVIYTLMFGYGMPTRDTAQFTNESACQIYLHNTYKESVISAFKIYCADISPLMCQGKVCGSE